MDIDQIDIELDHSKGKPVPFVIIQNKKFLITEEAKQIFHSNNYNTIGIIALVGKYRTGKSFLMNRVLLNQKKEKGFDVGPTIRPCTKGIWMWSEPIMVENNHNKEKFPVFLIDTEGLSAYDEEINHDTKIFLIAVLISSLFIYNTFGNIDETAINSLNFIINLSTTLKISENEKKSNENPEEYSKYFPSLLWLLRDFSLKLEDVEGNTITVREYLENSLQLQKGNSPSVEEKNKLRRLITTYFRDRDCFALVRPVEKEKDLQNLQKLDDSIIRPEFLEQAGLLRNKVMKKVKPKTFNNKLISSPRLVELLQSILDSINSGSIPVIENSWNYVVHTECIKNLTECVNKYKNKIKKFKEENSENPTFFYDFEIYQKSLEISLLGEFQNISADEAIVSEFVIKLKEKITEENKFFSEENRKLFEKKLIESLDANTKKLTEAFETNKYAKNYYQFFQDLENLKEITEAMIPDFPMKKEIIFEKMIEIIKKFIEMTFIKNKILNEKEIVTLKKDLQMFSNKFDLKIEEFSTMRSQIEKLNNQVLEYKLKEKTFEEKVKEIEKEKKNLQIESEKKLSESKKESENKLLQTKKDFMELEEEVKTKEETILALQFSEQKFNIIKNQKFEFLEREVNSYRERLDQIKKENTDLKNRLDEEMNKSEDLKTENIKIRLLENENDRLKKEIEKNAGTLRDNSARKISQREKDLTQNLTRMNINSDYSIDNCSNTNLRTIPHNIIETEFLGLNAGLMDIPLKHTNSNSNNSEIVALLKSQLESAKNQVDDMKRMYDDLIMALKSKMGSNHSRKTGSSNSMHSDCINEGEYLELLDSNKNLSKSLVNSETRCNKLEETLQRFKSKLILFKSAAAFQCEICQKLFSYDQFKSHYPNCQSNQWNKPGNYVDIKKDKLGIKILKGVLNKDTLGKPYIEYTIDITYNSKSWRVNRKFNQIANFHKSLKNFLTEVKFPDSSLIFSKIHLSCGDQSNSNNFHENKIKYLEKYLKDISEIDTVCKSKIYRKFFDFEDESEEENIISSRGRLEEKNKYFYNKEVLISTLEDYDSIILEPKERKVQKSNLQDNLQLLTEKVKSFVEESEKFSSNSNSNSNKKSQTINTSNYLIKKIETSSIRKEKNNYNKSQNMSSRKEINE